MKLNKNTHVIWVKLLNIDHYTEIKLLFLFWASGKQFQGFSDRFKGLFDSNKTLSPLWKMIATIFYISFHLKRFWKTHFSSFFLGLPLRRHLPLGFFFYTLYIYHNHKEKKIRWKISRAINKFLAHLYFTTPLSHIIHQF